MEDLAGEEVNGLTQLLSGVDELQPRKVEEIVPNINLPEDTYIIYPTGGYHPFYGTPNTLPRYQLLVWPYIKRIKFSDRLGEKGLQAIRENSIGKTQFSSQVNCIFSTGYYRVTLKKRTRKKRVEYSQKLKKDGNFPQKMKFDTWTGLIHRLVALAWIPNPENKPFVLHINDDSTNYLIENLKWGTGSDNQRGSIRRRPGTMEQKYLNLVNRGVIKG